MTAQIRFKPHLKAHKISAGEVVLLGESEQYVLRGAVYGALTPLLDGGHDADALASQLAGQFRPELVHYALMQLEAKGYAESGAGSGGGADLAWWSAKGIQPGEADRTLMRREVALLNAGAPEAAYAPLLAALGERFRIAETAGPDGFAVIACSDYLDPRLAAAVSAAMNTGCPALPVRIGGGQIWLGPLLDGGARDFELLQRRMTNIRSPERSILACGGAFPLLPEQGIAESHKFAASAIASAVLATLLGQPPKGIRRGVITLDPWTLESKTHVLAGGGPAETMAVPEIGEEREPVRLEARPRRFSSDGGVRSATPEETLERLEPLVSEITGIIPELHKFPAPEGMHVFGASQLFASRGADHRQNRVLGRSSSAAGKGQTAIQAKVSCLGEAVERYSCSFFGDEPVRRARISGFGGQAIGPAELLLFSERQYALRDVNNPVRGAFNWTPMPFDPERETGWTPAWSLTHERTVWLPAAYCYFGAPFDPDHDFCRADSNGCAAGNTREEAILQGFLELVERDACALWWYNRLRRPGIDLGSFRSPYLDRMQELYNRHGRTLIALDVTSDLGIPAVVALSWREPDGGRIHVGLGTHLDGALAVSRAVSELSQSTHAEFSPGSEKQNTHGPELADLDRWMAEATIASDPHVLPAPGSLRVAADFPSLSSGDLRDDVAGCIELLRTQGLEMIVLEHTRPDIGFPVMRVTVPGLRHFWERLAPGRLYSIPAAMGWLKQPLCEEELNPKPFFI